MGLYTTILKRGGHATVTQNLIECGHYHWSYGNRKKIPIYRRADRGDAAYRCFGFGLGVYRKQGQF